MPVGLFHVLVTQFKRKPVRIIRMQSHIGIKRRAMTSDVDFGDHDLYVGSALS
jgi:hypothetical protein